MSPPSLDGPDGPHGLPAATLTSRTVVRGVRHPPPVAALVVPAAALAVAVDTPAAVPDDPDVAPTSGRDVRSGLDTDGDGRADTLVTARATELLLHTDLDDDGLADHVLAVEPDGSVRSGTGPEDPGCLDAVDGWEP